MTVAHGDHDLPPLSSDEIERLFTRYVTDTAPRLFALCREYCEDDEDWLFAWGAALADIAVLFGPNGKIIGTFSTADSALNLFSHIEDLRLVWVDPTIMSQVDVVPA